MSVSDPSQRSPTLSETHPHLAGILKRVENEDSMQLLRPFIVANPEFFQSLSARLSETLDEYPEIKDASIRSYREPEMGQPVLRVELAIDADPDDAFQIRRQLFHSWLKALYSESPMSMAVTLKRA